MTYTIFVNSSYILRLSSISVLIASGMGLFSSGTYCYWFYTIYVSGYILSSEFANTLFSTNFYSF